MNFKFFDDKNLLINLSINFNLGLFIEPNYSNFECQKQKFILKIRIFF